MKNAQKIEMVGKAIFGENWKAPLAAKLGVNERTMRRWADGEFEVSAGVMAELPRLLRENKAQIEEATRILKYDELLRGQSVNTAHLASALQIEFHDYPADDMQDLSNAVDEWVQLNIERPLAENLGLDATKDDVYEYIENVDDLRDCQSDFIASRFQ